MATNDATWPTLNQDNDELLHAVETPIYCAPISVLQLTNGDNLKARVCAQNTIVLECPNTERRLSEQSLGRRPSCGKLRHP